LSEAASPVELVFLWHHHQPDYRSPRSNRALLPWVRLHATKDYLDMARRLERYPTVRMAFNFVPSLLDQLEAAEAGGPDALFDLLARPVAELSGEERLEVAGRCLMAPRHAFERWPRYAALARRIERPLRATPAQAPGPDALLALEAWFLLAWIDPMFHGEPAAAAALEHQGRFEPEHRDGLLRLHRRLVGEVIPAYRALAGRGQIELSASPYFHPILPLLVSSDAARRARPELRIPARAFEAPEDATRQVERARERHARAFGAPPLGMWPPEGSVSPEVAEIAARSGVRWLASDEGVLWNSLPGEERRRGALYRPWRLATAAGDVALLFRDHELSDRIGFVYHHWHPEEAAGDFLARVRRLGREHGGRRPPVVTVILDGENCWEQYPDDGGPFLEALYAGLAGATDIRTRTPAEAIDAAGVLDRLPRLHSGSWIDADFHIWIGHPEKNRAWELLERTRRALVETGAVAGGEGGAWESLYAAEGSDWFWWYGDDHHTADKAIFDRLFREHLQAVYERTGRAAPAWLQVPIARVGAAQGAFQPPIALVRPILDGRRTHFYEWHGAGHFGLAAGGTAMHRGAGLARDLYYGFDTESLFLRIDFDAGGPPGPAFDLALEFLTPRALRVVVRGLVPGPRPMWRERPPDESTPLAGARCEVGGILEIGLPFASLGFRAGEPVELVIGLLERGEPVEHVPGDDLVRFDVPDPSFAASLWSA
jgi:alpha-amylase/alpha-mannosidase (GH57 family)